MIALYFRIALFVVGLIGAVILFALAFTGAAIVVLILLALGAIFGRVRGRTITIVTRRNPFDAARPPPPVIDHDPNDLPGHDRRQD